MAEPASDVAVALLYDTRERGAHLREALAAFGAPIVYEASTHALDRDALERSQANVVVVNLDPQQDPDLDDVYGLLTDERYRVVFNDGEVSSALSGWDQARWARHLAAKILGADVDPPRPADAEPVPVASARADEGTARSAVALAAIDAAESPREAPSEPVAAFHPAVDDDAAETVTLASDAVSEPEWSVDQASADPQETPASTPSVPADALSFDLDELLATPEASRREDFSSLFDETPARDTPTPPASAPPESGSLDGIDDLLAQFDAAVPTSTEPAVSDEFAAYDFELGDGREEQVAAPVSPAPSIPLGDFALSLDDIESDEATSGDADGATTAPAAASAPMPPRDAPSIAVPTQWSLEDMIDDLGDSPAPPAAPPTGPAQFGIEKLSAEEFLSPPAEESVAPPAAELESSDFAFELIPIEEAVSPTAVESPAHENRLETAAVPRARVRRVWVLGASIGGPESVREFLAELPRDYPAVFLLAQHLGGEFVDMMTRQLAKATPLTVRTPTHGERVGHGEVVVVPTTHRLLLDAEGVVVLEKNAEQTPYSPSIDQVLRDVADRFGAGGGAIVFSGMSTDALEGSRYLTEKGGRVYAQDPDTCVVSSMVDGVVDAGLVGFVGSPKELAEKLLAEPK